MVRDRIVVFNRVTDPTLENCCKFEDLLENHYKKFTHGYEIIATNNFIEKVDTIVLKTFKNKIEFTIMLKKPMDNETAALWGDCIDENMVDKYKDKEELSEDGLEIYLTISKRK